MTGYRRGLSPERPVHRVGRHRSGRVCVNSVLIHGAGAATRSFAGNWRGRGSRRASRDRGYGLLPAGLRRLPRELEMELWIG